MSSENVSSPGAWRPVYDGPKLLMSVTKVKLVSAAANSVVFENPAHDFPTRIAYRRHGKVLTATISGPGGAGSQSWRYVRQ